MTNDEERATLDAESQPANAVGPIREYRIDVPQAVLDDLRDRLRSWRHPNQIEGVGWSQGIALDYLKSLVPYWAEQYDWRAYESYLNGFDQFETEIDAQRIHFFHQRSPDPNAIPILLLHGWPMTGAEYAKVLQPLSNPAAYQGAPADAFHVVAPSLPGMGFSGPTTRRGWGPRRTARAFVDLMAALGYERFGVQAHDMGSAVAMNLADAHPENVIGLHLNYVPDMRSKAAFIEMRLPDDISWESLTPTERQGMMNDAKLRSSLMGWHDAKNQAPQNIGYMMEDSPVALFVVVSPADENECLRREVTLGRDTVLNHITTTWVTGTGASSCRFYYELAQAILENVPHARIEVPVGIAVFPRDSNKTPRRWVEKRYNVVHWREQRRGGHFAALDAPDLFVEDVRLFFSGIR
jgi:pimeloyl-ACP methyl ester carboxylesterase